MTYFSMFAGIGGFEVGIQAAMPYAKCVGFSEINTYATSIYKRHFPTHKNYGDATKINQRQLPEFDCLVGGFPCQPFSVSGKRGGFDDTRGELFFDIARVLRAKQPKMFILENVKGLLSHDEGRAFGVIIKTLDELRYDVQWQVLNCKHHTTPQDRNRVFIVGYSRTCREDIRKILPIRYTSSETVELSGSKAVANTLLKKYADGDRAGSYIIEGRQKKIDLLNPTKEALQPQSKANRIYRPEGLAPCLVANGGGLGAKTGLYAIPVLTPNRVNKRQNGRRFKKDGDASFTLTTQDNHGVLTDGRIRRLTPIECERLQDFPDDWTKYGTNNELISDAQRYACTGNAVNTKVVKSIAEKMRDSLISKTKQQKLWIPKIVKFSGGRSSGMMLLQLLAKGELVQWRGDCVIFCNTSAEHKATYAFVARMKHICEQDYNIPFFIIEYQTYETKKSRGYLRKNTYRLVNELPYSDNNTNGYRYKGEVFEELISNQATLPNIYQRTCTIAMKIFITNEFLGDWYSQKNKIEYLGHSGLSKRKDADIIKTHKKYNGTLSDEVIIDKKAFVQQCTCYRPSQAFADFTNADTHYSNKYLMTFVKNDKAQLFKKNGLRFISYLGIRHDEKIRAVRIRKRIIEAKLDLKRNKKTYKYATQPPNEIINIPMIKARIDKQDVISFWHKRDDDLDLPYHGLLSNCVFCPLKGNSKNQFIHQKYSLNTDPNTPQSLEWWSNIETKYSRKTKKSNDNDYTHIGFYGVASKYAYKDILNGISGNPKTTLLDVVNSGFNMDCNCTD